MESVRAYATLPPERAGQPATPELLARRDAITAAMDAGVWRTDPPAQESMIGGIRSLRFMPPGESRGTVLHIHGGGFRLGCPEQVGPFAAALAKRCDVTVVCPAYRLAPEHPFPAGLADALTVMMALTDSTRSRLVVSGDSAGGGFAAGLAALSAGHAVRLAGLALLSPWLDLRVNSSCYEDNAASDPLFSAESAREAAALYLQGLSPNTSLASPLLDPVESFPPTFINVGDGEVLADDARRLHDKLRAAGIPALLQIVEGMEHVAVTRGLALRGAAETFAALGTFIDEVLAQAT